MKGTVYVNVSIVVEAEDDEGLVKAGQGFVERIDEATRDGVLVATKSIEATVYGERTPGAPARGKLARVFATPEGVVAYMGDPEAVTA